MALLRFGCQGRLTEEVALKRDLQGQGGGRVKSEERGRFPGRGHSTDKGSEAVRENSQFKELQVIPGMRSHVEQCPKCHLNVCRCDPQCRWEPWRALDLTDGWI